MKLKKWIAMIGVTVLAVGCLSACGNSGSNTAANSSEAQEKAPAAESSSVAEEAEEQAPAADKQEAEAVTIWYYWETEGHQVALDKVVTDYNAIQSDYVVSAKYVPFADFKKQLSIGASASELPDMVIIDSPDHASYAAMGIFADITGKFDVSNYYEGTVNSCTVEGGLYGVPFGVNCLSLYYNKDMLDAAGCSVPATWDELLETAKKLTGGNVTGLAFSSVQNEEGTFNFTPWLWSTGASSYEMNSEGGIRALTFAKDLIESGAMSKECINWTQGDVMNQFISGNVAMMVNGPWQIPTMQAEAPDLNWDVALIPKDSQYASVLGGENYAVIADRNEAGALSFLEYATAEEQVKFMMSSFGYISADQTIAEKQFEEGSPYLPFVEQLKYAQPRGPLVDWPSVSDAISLAFNQVMTGTETPETAAAEAQKTIDMVLK